MQEELYPLYLLLKKEFVALKQKNESPTFIKILMYNELLQNNGPIQIKENKMVYGFTASYITYYTQ